MKLYTFLSASLIGISLLFVGCGTSPKTQLYILNTLDRDTPSVISDAQNIVIKVGPVSLPATLDQEPIVTRIGSNMLLADEFNRWSGDFQKDIERILGENISILLPTSKINLSRETVLLPLDFQVIVNVREFDGELGGNVILNANWTVVGKAKNKSITAHKSVLTEASNGTSYQSYVTAHSRLLARLSQEIAKEIGGQLNK